MNEEPFYVVEKKTHVAWVYLNRPEKKNAMSPPAWREIIPIFKDLDEDREIRAIVLTGKGSSFSTGLDLMAMVEDLPEVMEKEQLGGVKQQLMRKICRMQDAITCVESCRKPVIAAVQGYCIGAGLDLATARDFRIASNNARFSVKEAAVGFVADVGVLQRLPLIVGQGIARELAMTARMIDAKRALEILLVNEVMEGEEKLMARAEAMALEIAENSPLAVQATKEVMNFGVGKTIAEGLSYVAAMSTTIIPSQDLYAAFKAFEDKKKPVFPGR